MMKFAGMRGGLRSVPGIIACLVLWLTAQSAVLEDLRIDPAENRTRLVIQSDQIPRYVIDFDDSSLYVTFDSLDIPESELAALTDDATELVADYSCVLRDGKTYLKLAITQPFYVRYFELAEPERLVIDLYPQMPKIAADSTTSQGETAEAIPPQIETEPTAQPPQQPPPRPEGFPLTLLSSLNWQYIALPVAIILLLGIGIVVLRRAKKREVVHVPKSLQKEKDLAAEKKVTELDVGKITAELEDTVKAKKRPKTPKKVKPIDAKVDDIGRTISELSDKKPEPLTAAELEIAPPAESVEEPKQKEKSTKEPEIKRLEATDFGLELPPSKPEIEPEEVPAEKTEQELQQPDAEKSQEVEKAEEPDEKLPEEAQQPEPMDAQLKVPDLDLELPPDFDEIASGKPDTIDSDLPPDIAKPERKKPTEEDLRRIPGITDPHEDLAEELEKTDDLIAKLTEKTAFDLELPPDIEEAKTQKETEEVEKAAPPDLPPPAPPLPEVEKTTEVVQPVEPPETLSEPPGEEAGPPEKPAVDVPAAEKIESQELPVTRETDFTPTATESPVTESKTPVTPEAPQSAKSAEEPEEKPAEADAFGLEAEETPEPPVEPAREKPVPEEATEKPVPVKSIEKAVDETAPPEEPKIELPKTPVIKPEIPSVAKDIEPETAPPEEEKPAPADLAPPPKAKPEPVEPPVATRPTEPTEKASEKPDEVDALGLEATESIETPPEPPFPEQLEAEEKPSTPSPGQPPETKPEEFETAETTESKQPEGVAGQSPDIVEEIPRKAPVKDAAEKPEIGVESPAEAVEKEDVFDSTLTYIPVEKSELPVASDELEVEGAVPADDTAAPTAPAEKLETKELAEPEETLGKLEKPPEAPQVDKPIVEAREDLESAEALKVDEGAPPPESAVPPVMKPAAEEELEPVEAVIKPEEPTEEPVQIAEAISTAGEQVTEIRQVVDEGEAVLRFEEGIIQWPVHILEGNRTGRIMVVDDEPEIVRTLKEFLSREEYDVLGLTDSISALESYGDWHPDLIIADVVMPEMSGVDLVQKIRQEDGVNKVIFMSGRTERDTVIQVFDQELEDGRYEFFRKPLSLVQIGSRIRDYFSSARELLSLHFDDPSRFTAMIQNLAPLQLVSLQRFLWDRIFEVSSNVLGKKIEPYFVTDRLEPPADYMRRVGCQEREDYCIADVCFRSNPQCAAERLHGEIEVMRQILAEFRQEYLQSDSRTVPAGETVGHPSEGVDETLTASGPPPRRTLHRPDGERNR